jgi:hypothetical protein
MWVKTFGLLNENCHIWMQSDTASNYSRQFVDTCLQRISRYWQKSYCMPCRHFYNRRTRTEVKCILQDTLLLGIGRWTQNNDRPRNSFSYADCDRKKESIKWIQLNIVVYEKCREGHRCVLSRFLLEIVWSTIPLTADRTGLRGYWFSTAHQVLTCHSRHLQ